VNAASKSESGDFSGVEDYILHSFPQDTFKCPNATTKYPQKISYSYKSPVLLSPSFLL
jgi:hypothetical protein